MRPGGGDKNISFAVKDTGIGIPADKQKIIFEAFQQPTAPPAAGMAAPGLGLSISRELAALLGGKITLSSEAEKGSEFVLTIPYRAAVKDTLPEAVTTVENFKPELQILKPAAR